MLNQSSWCQGYILKTTDIVNNKFHTNKKYLSSFNFMIYHDNSSPIFFFFTYSKFLTCISSNYIVGQNRNHANLELIICIQWTLSKTNILMQLCKQCLFWLDGIKYLQASITRLMLLNSLSMPKQYIWLIENVIFPYIYLSEIALEILRKHG